MGIAETDQAGTFGIFADAGFEENRTHFIRSSAGGAHGGSLYRGRAGMTSGNAPEMPKKGR
jgi:hypothetical protein